MKLSNEQLKSIGNVGLRIGKAIVVEGTKALVLKGAAAAITTGFEDGIDGIKRMTLDDILKDKKDESEKKPLFGRKKKVVEIEIDDTEVTM